MDYIRFKPSVKPLHEETDKDLYFVYSAEDFLVKKVDDELDIPTYEDLKDKDFEIVNKQCMGSYNGVNCFSVEVLDEIEKEMDKLICMTLMECATDMDEDHYLLATKGKLLSNWQRRNRFCGVCGSKMYHKDSFDERSMICHRCSSPTWPRTSPAILVAVTKGDEILLVNAHNYPKDIYSVVAGFVDYGETFEDSVKREVLEEVGIRIKNIEYFGSKPWPFPNSMMVAYKAEYESGDIHIDESEIRSAGWYSRDNMPKLFENKNSIACDLIRDFLDNK